MISDTYAGPTPSGHSGTAFDVPTFVPTGLKRCIVRLTSVGFDRPLDAARRLRDGPSHALSGAEADRLASISRAGVQETASARSATKGFDSAPCVTRGLPHLIRSTSSDDLIGSFMAGLKDKRGFIDKDRLDLSERKAVEFWMKRWGVTQDQLIAAHRKVGRMTKDIAAELGKKR